MLPRSAGMLSDVRKRISAMKQYASLGSGFKIAMRDLEIRGAGNLLGSEQSGHITAVGFELYCQLLKQSVGSMKGETVKPRVEVRVTLDFLGESSGLPENYATESQHRIEIYRKLAQATDKVTLESLRKEMRDRFGPLPPAVELLLAVAELKILASERNITVVEVKEDKVMLTRNKEFITLGGKFPRLTKKTAEARVKEIKKVLLAI
jgi:transcription-repair coupling factor (superfamily II helicase)